MNPLFALLPPLLVIPLVVVFGERQRRWREASLLVAGLTLLCINIQLLLQLASGQPVVSGSLPLFPTFELYLRAEPIGVVFALLASLLWPVTTLYSMGYLRHSRQPQQTRFYLCFALAMAAVMAAAYAGNLATLFVAYEVITLATYPLVIHAGTANAKRAGRQYIGLLMGCSLVLLLPGVILIGWLAGSTDFTSGGLLAHSQLAPHWLVAILALVVFGSAKAAIMPFHRWLPAAMVAPTPVSALLHAVAVVKTGVFLIVKVAVYIFGFDLLQGTMGLALLQWVAAVTLVLASLIALSKDNLKERLAYSTISQLAYIVLAALLLYPMAAQGAALHMVTHAVGKITLFFCAGVILITTQRKLISELDGLGHQLPLTMTAFLVAALSICGLPPLAGLWSKWAMGQGALEADQLWVLWVLLFSSLLNVMYLLPIPLRAFFASAPSAINFSRAPITCQVAIVITSSLCLVLFFAMDPLWQWLEFL